MCSSSLRWSSRRCCTCPIRRWTQAKAADRGDATTARCRSSPISSSRNTRSSRCCKSVAETLPSVTVRYGCEFLSFDAGRRIRHRDGQRQRRRDLRRSRAHIWSAATAAPAWCASSSASSSPAKANMLQLRQALYRCDDLFERIPIGKGRHYHVADKQSTHLIVQDSTRHFTLHSVVETRRGHGARCSRRPSRMPVQIRDALCRRVAAEPAAGRPLRATAACFLAGDAAHLMIPTGGLGMNTGVGDAIDLAWKLAATLAGLGRTGPARLLRDRAPAGRRTQCRRLALRLARPAQVARAWRPNIRDDTPEGAGRAPTWRASPTSSSARPTR